LGIRNTSSRQDGRIASLCGGVAAGNNRFFRRWQRRRGGHERETDTGREPPAVRGNRQGQVAAEKGCNLLDNRQAEAGTGLAGLPADETTSHLPQLADRNTRSVVLDRENGPPAFA